MINYYAFRTQSMRPRVAFVTSRMEPTQTFLFRDICALSKYMEVSLYPLLPARNLDLIYSLLDNKRTLLRYFSSAFFITIIRANFKMFTEHTNRYFKAMGSLFKMHSKRPLDLAILLFLFPVMVAQAYLMEKDGVQHIHGYWASYATTFALIAASLLSVPYSMSIHAIDLLEERNALAVKTAKSEKIIACSKSALSLLTGRIPDIEFNKILLCPHGLDLKKYKYYKRLFKHSSRPPKILSIGRMVPKKGFVTLVKAINLIASQGQQIDCTICGPVKNRKYYKMLKKAIKNSHKNACFKILGWQPPEKIILEIKKCDVYVQASEVDKYSNDRDGIPNTVLESMALGTPVVATEVGGIPEVIHHGKTGLLTPPGNSFKLAKAIFQVLIKPQEATYRAEQARYLVEQKHCLELRGKILTNVFTSLIINSGSS